MTSFRCHLVSIFKMGHSRPLFLCFCLFNTQLTVNKCSIYINFCRRLDSNRGTLVLEATTLPTEPHNHCPIFLFLPATRSTKRSSSRSTTTTDSRRPIKLVTVNRAGSAICRQFYFCRFYFFIPFCKLVERRRHLPTKKCFC